MKRKTLIALGLVTVTALGGIAAIPVLAHGSGDGPWRPHMEWGAMHGGKMGGTMGGMMGGGMPGPAMMQESFAEFDADGDGRITATEVEAALKAKLGTFDGDGDGTLSLTEYAALFADQSRRHMVDRFQALDEDGDGQVTAEEFQAPARHFARMMKWHRNGGDEGHGSAMHDEQAPAESE